MMTGCTAGEVRRDDLLGAAGRWSAEYQQQKIPDAGASSAVPAGNPWHRLQVKAFTADGPCILPCPHEAFASCDCYAIAQALQPLWLVAGDPPFGHYCYAVRDSSCRGQESLPADADKLTANCRRQPLGLNLIVLLVLVIAKFPSMHKVRIFGINKY